LSNYYTKSEVNNTLGSYYTKTETNSTLGNYYTATECDGKIEEELGTQLENYYTATECDGKIEEELETQLENYYTATECDDKFALIGSGSGMGVDLSNYYTKSEVNNTLGSYYTKTETNSTLGNYYTATECDDKIEEELDAQFENYYTATECDDKFALIGSGSGSNGGESGGLIPENKGELVLGNGSGAALLAAGQNQQLLVANPNAALGAEWCNYPWQLLQEIIIDSAVSAVIFENVFNASLFWHYKLSYSFITTSIASERLCMVFGYDNGDTTIWETSINEYTYNTSDFSGSVAKYSTYQFVDGFFGFGSDNAIYRNDGGWINGEMDLWNNGNINHKVQARAYTSSYRIWNDSFISNGGIYNFIYRNAGENVIRSLKIYVANGTLDSGKLTFYGIR
ncbi:MAG: hypothetical protein LBJ13_02940, partial [Puniceicoccales bacterium]|nr:hypothetical protein [Puniceicoccales bacterium]